MIESPVIAKISGILAGTVLSLIFVPPRSVSGFFRRVSSAVIFGWFLGHLVLFYMDWEPTDENIAAAWAIAAFISWWTMGIGKRVTEKFVETKAKTD